MWLVTVTSGPSSGVSGSVWSAGRGFGAVSGRVAGVASGSRTAYSPSQGSGSACAVGSNLGSSTTGRFSVSTDSVVLVSSIRWVWWIWRWRHGFWIGVGTWHFWWDVPRSVETGELGWQSAPFGLDIELGDQSQSSYAVFLQNPDSRASVCPHAQYLVRLGDGAVSCTSRVPFWQAQARVLCWCNAACLLAEDRLSRPIHHDGIELFDSALHNCGAEISGQSQGHPHFKYLISRKGAKLGHMLSLIINRKPSLASPMTPWHLYLERPWKVKVKVTQILKPYIS